jgi:hypothetical protein
MPEERPIAEELAFDEFLMQPYATTFLEASTETVTMPRSSLIECIVFIRILFIDYLILGFGRSS